MAFRHGRQKKLKPDQFFMGKPSQNYGVRPKYGALSNKGGVGKQAIFELSAYDWHQDR